MRGSDPVDSNELARIFAPNTTGKLPAHKWRSVEILKVRTKDASVVGAYGHSPTFKDEDAANRYIQEMILPVLREIDPNLKTATLSDAREEAKRGESMRRHQEEASPIVDAREEEDDAASDFGESGMVSQGELW